ncbi:MAG TPA: S41 family peptidase [Candidatus Baltobacteraceae bacterium]|nr:S41 family peptidase [Candidatus Baltobacteraceae bacterium]
MTGKFRALLAALIVVIAASAGALYIGYRNGVQAAQAPTLSYNVATTGDVRSLFDSGSGQAQLLDVAVRKLETNFYKPVDPQDPIRGEEKELTQYLQTKNIAKPQLPAESATGNPAQDGSLLANVLQYAQAHYGSKLGSGGGTDLTETALRGVMNSVKDPYTVYLSPHEMQGLSESLSGGNFGGIGVYIYQLKSGEVILQPIEGLPASRAGMKPGEVVDTVNGRPIKGITLDTVERMIRGDAGSNVTITTHVYKNASEHRYSIVREIIHVPTVRAKMEDGFDYIRLSDFGETSADEMRKALIDGKTKGAKGYILDLRDNGGGLVDAAVKISSYFIPQGVIVSTIDRAGNKDSQEALGDALGGLQPLVILVNKYTASASEITSGALQDYHLAKLVGTKTFGKGVVQSIYPMPDDGALKITTARYVTPLGRDIQHKGIDPDVLVPQSVDPALIDTPADKQLIAAKAQLQQLLR